MVKDDIEKAREIVKDRFREDALFNDLSGVYKVTNENMNDENYIRLLQDNDRILSVIGSGDQILNSILGNTYNIDAFDISIFPKHLLFLKIGAIESINYEEITYCSRGGPRFCDRRFRTAPCRWYPWWLGECVQH